MLPIAERGSAKLAEPDDMPPDSTESAISEYPVQNLLLRLITEETGEDCLELQRHVRKHLDSAFRGQLSIEDREDLSQEVTLRLILRLRAGGFESKGEAAAVGWIKIACVRSGIDRLKKRKRRREEAIAEQSEAEDDFRYVPRVQAEFDAWLERWSEAERIREAGRLGLSEKEYYCLFLFAEGGADEQIADFLTARGIPTAVGSVATTRKRATKKIAERLKGRM